jgi:hypothetical protein
MARANFAAGGSLAVVNSCSIYVVGLGGVEFELVADLKTARLGKGGVEQIGAGHLALFSRVKYEGAEKAAGDHGDAAGVFLGFYAVVYAGHQRAFGQIANRDIALKRFVAPRQKPVLRKRYVDGV